jgi:hypothetical protein
MKTMDLLGYLEKSFDGKAEAMIDDDLALRLAVTYFDDRPIWDLRSYCTLGLSVATLERDGEMYRQELMFVAYNEIDKRRIVNFLGGFAEDIVRRGHAVVRGDVVTPREPVVLGTLMNFVFVCRPIVLESAGAAVFEDAEPPIDFWWLVPIHDDEAQFARTNGYEALEFALSNSYLPLWDLHRPSVFSPEARALQDQG